MIMYMMGEWVQKTDKRDRRGRLLSARYSIELAGVISKFIILVQ